MNRQQYEAMVAGQPNHPLYVVDDGAALPVANPEGPDFAAFIIAYGFGEFEMVERLGFREPTALDAVRNAAARKKAAKEDGGVIAFIWLTVVCALAFVVIGIMNIFSTQVAAPVRTFRPGDSSASQYVVPQAPIEIDGIKLHCKNGATVLWNDSMKIPKGCD